jgi:hypothetical protein
MLDLHDQSNTLRFKPSDDPLNGDEIVIVVSLNHPFILYLKQFGGQERPVVRSKILWLKRLFWFFSSHLGSFYQNKPI